MTPEGTREPFVSGIVNATSMAIGPDGHLYVSSRFEGAVYRVDEDGAHEQVASDLGVACGLAFDDDGCDVRRRPLGHDLPGARRHGDSLRDAAGERRRVSPGDEPDGRAVRDGPDAGTYDHVYRIDRDGEVRTLPHAFGRPQGLAFCARRRCCTSSTRWPVRAASTGSRDLDGEPELVVSGGALVGVAFGPAGELVVASNDTAYRFGPRRA